MDWEQPRTIQGPARYDSPHTSIKKLYDGRFEQDDVSRTTKSHPDNLDIEDDSTGNLQHLPVSIWRTYFIANEWFKIQTKRRINIALQIIFTLFMLEVETYVN
jgi:hypothetical protein